MYIHYLHIYSVYMYAIYTEMYTDMYTDTYTDMYTDMYIYIYVKYILIINTYVI